MNRGAEALSKHVPGRGDQVKVAEDLDVDQGYLSRILRAERVPGLRIRQLLRDRFGIGMELWDIPAEKGAA